MESNGWISWETTPKDEHFVLTHNGTNYGFAYYANDIATRGWYDGHSCRIATPFVWQYLPTPSDTGGSAA